MYNALKGIIGQIEGIKDVQWFNVQYEEIISVAPAVFIEFLPSIISRESKLVNRMVVDIRLHVVSKKDADIPDSAINMHEILAHAVSESVTGLCLPFEGELKSRPLQLCGWSHLHKQKEYIVSLIDLKTQV